MSLNGAVGGVAMEVDDSYQAPNGNDVCSESQNLPKRGDTRIVVIVYGPEQDRIVSVFAEVLGRPYRIVPAFKAVTEDCQGLVIGIRAEHARIGITDRNRELVVAINVHCIGLGLGGLGKLGRPGSTPDPHLSVNCDYEFLYTEAPFFRRDLARFISFTLGQTNHDAALMAKSRTYLISTTFPDVRAALPNIDIFTVGADGIEIRVDLLQEPTSDNNGEEGQYLDNIPSLAFVGEQVMLLRQHTELPIIFTTRCVEGNGRFPMDRPMLYYEYLYRAIQWGVEYIDVEIWLPEEIRRNLWERKGNSRIISAFHDFSGNFKWLSPQAEVVFSESRKYADMVKMIAVINDPNENLELEYFRSKIQTEFPNGPPLSALNMGETGHFSTALNKCFTPITHPLLPIIPAPGQMSADQINSTLVFLGQLPKKSIYRIGTRSSRISNPQAPFYQKCFNELGLPHQFAVVERQGYGSASIESWCNQKNFGGAYLNPPMSILSLTTAHPQHGSFFPSLNRGSGPILTEAARIIGMTDTIVVRTLKKEDTSSCLSNMSCTTPLQSSSSLTQHNDRPHPLALPHHLGVAGGVGGIHAGAGVGGGDVGVRGGGCNSDNINNNNNNNNISPITQIILDNATWRGILSTLTRDFAPSAYVGRSVVVVAKSREDVGSVLYALKTLRVGKIYTVGFKTATELAKLLDIEAFGSLEDLRRVCADDDDDDDDGNVIDGDNEMVADEDEDDDGGDDGDDGPLLVVSALGLEKRNLVAMILRVFGVEGGERCEVERNAKRKKKKKRRRRKKKKVFLDLAGLFGTGIVTTTSSNTAAAVDGAVDSAIVAENNGFVAYSAADIAAFTTVETLKLLVGQNVPYSFVKLASPRDMYY